ncbi:MAG: integration host factor subunit beta [Syntrophaceae bacterium]|jgi:integration host factor subunit beta|nr:integration host factor subunit beta [Syntrophaceae bacterium]OPX99589.1 MAG: DNA-binding protein HU [Syntrophorhabdus sp. PtaB.Bin027]
MNKYDLITLLASKENLTEVNATRIVNLIFDGFKDALVKGDRIEIRWFGSFVVREYRSYAGRNPKTGKVVEVKSKRLPFFKVGKELRESINT